MTTSGRTAAILACFIAGMACSDPAPTTRPRFDIAFRAASDTGEPLAGVTFATRAQRLGVTGSSGTLAVRLKGDEGRVVPVVVTCPPSYLSPKTTPELRLTTRRAIDGQSSPVISFETTCTRQTREIVVVVHAENGAALPVSISGKPSGATDDAGNAHVLLHLDRAVRSVDVSLDTSHHQQLKPQNPSRTFQLDGGDAILLFEQSFTKPKPKRRALPRKTPKRHVPYRID